MGNAEREPRSRGATIVRRIVRSAAHALAGGADGDRALRLVHALGRVRDTLGPRAARRGLAHLRGRPTWPVTAGAWVVGDPQAPVAVCTLSSNDLVRTAAGWPGVAIAGRVYVPNLGIEKIIRNVTANPSIRVLLLCGKDSPVFQPGQALVALMREGVDAEGRIIGAVGPRPVLMNLSAESIQRFRQQIEVVDLAGTLDSTRLAEQVAVLAARSFEVRYLPPGPSEADGAEEDAAFVSIPPGGGGGVLEEDPAGFFVITLDLPAEKIVLHHYRRDHSPGHEIRARSANGILRAVVRARLVSRLDHAGYLGAELARAETALRLGLPYEQDRPAATGPRENAVE